MALDGTLETDGTGSALARHLVRHVILEALVEITAVLWGQMIATADPADRCQGGLYFSLWLSLVYICA